MRLWRLSRRHSVPANGTTMRWFGGVLVVLLMAGMAGCSAAAHNDAVNSAGSLGTRTPVGTVGVCLPHGKHHTRFLIGWETLTNTAATPVVVNAVALTDPHNLTVEQSQLVPLPNGLRSHNAVGTWAGRHPHFDPTTSRLMATSVPAVGASIASGETVNLVLPLSIGGQAGGWSGPARVTFTDASGGTHTWVGGSSMSFRATGRDCRGQH